MQEPSNSLKLNLAQGATAVGIWCSLSSALATEVVAGAGADWLLIDGEHSPNHLRSIMAQLQAVGQYAPEPVVRVPTGDACLIKQFLDIGARSLMVPNVRCAEQARQVVSATQYPPRGIRGFSGAHRANRFGRVSQYHETARENQLLIVQIESEEGVANAQEIAEVDGVDVIFIGPGDLSANMNAMRQANSDRVQSAIAEVLAAVASAGKPAGILSFDKADARRYIQNGFQMVAVGSDLALLARGSDELVAAFRGKHYGS